MNSRISADLPLPKRPSLLRRFAVLGWAGLRRLALPAATVAVVIGLAYAIENWRGWRTWQAEVQRLNALGISVEFDSYLPPPVPDERNFALTPLMRPLLDYEASPAVVWRDTNAYQRSARVLSLYRRGSEPGTGGWTQGKPVNLLAWQKYLVASTNQNAAPHEPPAPAVLRYLATLGPDFDAMTEAARLPECRFPVHYDEGYLALLPHLSRLLVMSRTYALRASARLVEGQTDGAWQDLQTTLRFADALATEPFQISQTVRQSVCNSALQVFWEGQTRHAWSAAQLTAFSERVASVDLVAGFRRAIAAERAGLSRAVQGLIHSAKARSDYADLLTPDGQSGPPYPLAEYLTLAPRGWLYTGLARTSQDFGQLEAVQPRDLPTFRATWKPVNSPSSLRFVVHDQYFQTVARDMGVNLIGAFRMQTRLQLARAASALERHRLATGAYPSQLADLPPAMLGELREDPINGQPLGYRAISAKEFRLWSVGEDGVDNGGAYPRPAARTEQELGDWVWGWPEPDAPASAE